mgnify:CR=1 FL=1
MRVSAERRNHERQKTCGLRHDVPGIDRNSRANLSQMEEIHAIGKAIRQRPEKGAAVAAAEFLHAISLTAQAFPRATCAGCAIFIGSMKMTKRSSGWR